MDPVLISAMLEKLIPIFAIGVMFGFPVAIVFLVQHFKFKNRELQAELESRRLLGERDKAYLEARIERLEQVVLAQAGHAYAAPTQPLAQPYAMPAGLPVQQAASSHGPLGPVQGAMLANPGLFEPPPVPADPEPRPSGKREPTR